MIGHADRHAHRIGKALEDRQPQAAPAPPLAPVRSITSDVIRPALIRNGVGVGYRLIDE